MLGGLFETKIRSPRKLRPAADTFFLLLIPFHRHEHWFNFHFNKNKNTASFWCHTKIYLYIKIYITGLSGKMHENIVCFQRQTLFSCVMIQKLLGFIRNLSVKMRRKRQIPGNGIFLCGNILHIYICMNEACASFQHILRKRTEIAGFAPAYNNDFFTPW